MTVCRISRNNAEHRIAAVLSGKADPGFLANGVREKVPAIEAEQAAELNPDLGQLAHDQIVRHIQSHFFGHPMSQLVDAVLRANGWTTKVSPPGPDGGVDILAGRGTLGLDQPRLCVQVKSQDSPADVTMYRGVFPVMFDVVGCKTAEALYNAIFARLLELELVHQGDLVIVTKGELSGVQGGTNSMQILKVILT